MSTLYMLFRVYAQRQCEVMALHERPGLHHSVPVCRSGPKTHRSHCQIFRPYRDRALHVLSTARLQTRHVRGPLRVSATMEE